jgi:hypothetical protein
MRIDTILRRYKSHWCIKSPPYFLSYATYVSATIHVRIAAENPTASESYGRLQNCLEILSEHQTLCRAPRRSVDILVNLMRRLNVNVGGMFTGTRDNDGQWASQYDGGALGMYSGCQSNKDAFEKVTSKSTQSQGNVNVVGVAMTDSVTSTTSHPSMGMSLSNDGSCEQANSSSLSTGNGIDSLFTDMNFDFDPLFGFDMDQADFLQDISF